MIAMLKVNEDIYRGCGLCARACPQGAISEMVVISPAELGTTVFCLKQQAADIIGRIDQLVAKP